MAIQGEFSSREQAQRAIESLKAAGFHGSQVRVWNIIPERVRSTPGSQSYAGTSYGGTSFAGGATIGAVTGVLLGGYGSLILGALVGGVVASTASTVAGSAYSGDDESMPWPTGVRIVIDGTSSGGDPATLLRSLGAANVR